MNGLNYAAQAAVSCLTFYCLFGVTRAFIFPRASMRLANHFVSGFHAILMLLLGAWAMRQGTFSWESIGDQAPAILRDVLCVSLGYFVYDLSCCWYIEYKTRSWNVANTVHHTVCTLGLCVAVFKGNSCSEVMACILLAETSTPFLHARYILKELTTGHELLMSLVEVGFAASFILFRIVLGPFLTWKTLASAHGSTLVKICGCGVQIVSFVWFRRVLLIARKKVNKLLFLSLHLQS